VALQTVKVVIITAARHWKVKAH